MKEIYERPVIETIEFNEFEIFVNCDGVSDNDDNSGVWTTTTSGSNDQ